MAKPTPAVAYVAEEPIYELFMNVRSTRSGTSMRLVWCTRTKGDRPDQGHRWEVHEVSPKPMRTVEHALNLAAWMARRALAGQWHKLR